MIAKLCICSMRSCKHVQMAGGRAQRRVKQAAPHQDSWQLYIACVNGFLTGSSRLGGLALFKQQD